MKPSLRFLLPLALALPLAAQASPFSVTAGYLSGFNSLKKATNNTAGFTAGVDYGTKVWGTDQPARIGLEFAAMPGSDWNGLKTSLTLLQFHGDLLIATGSPRINVVLGASFNAYSMSKSGTENTDDSLDVDHHFPVRDVKGLKLGLRAGVTVKLSERWSAELIFQQTELAGKDITDSMVRAGGVNPAWLELNARFRF